MKPFWKKSAEIAVLGALLVVVTSPITYKAFSQAAPIRGQVSAGVYENLVSDGAGHLIVNTAGVSSVGNTVAMTFSGVNLTNAGTTQLIAANALRKSLLIQNKSTTLNMSVGVTSPVTATNSLDLVPGASYYTTYNASTQAWYGIGAAAGITSAVVAEGQ